MAKNEGDNVPVVATFIGDSFTAGTGADPASNRFATLLAAAMGWTEDNQGVGSSVIADAQTDRILARTTDATDVAVWLAGYNDMRYFGSNADALAANAQAILWGAAWLAVPGGNRIAHNGGSVAYSGTWATAIALNGIRYATTVGATATFSVTGSFILISTAQAVSGGSFAISVDGVSHGTYSCLRPSANSPAGRAYNGGLAVITGLTPGSHAVVITSQSTSPAYFNWAAGVPSGGFDTAVFLGGTVRMPSASYANYSPYNNGSDAAADAYSAMIETAAETLRSAGLSVRHVRTLLDVPTEFATDQVHPNNAGHVALKNQFLTVTSPSPLSVTVNATIVGNSAILDASASSGTEPYAYEWSVTDSPDGSSPVIDDASIAGPSVTLDKVGSYTFECVVTDGTGAEVTDSITVDLSQTLTTITIIPSSFTMVPESSKQFTQSQFDQFGDAMSVTVPVTWSVDADDDAAGGSISNTGIYTSPATEGTDTVRVTGNVSGADGSAVVTIGSSGSGDGAWKARARRFALEAGYEVIG